MTAQDNAWTTRKASRGASRACNPETEFRAGHASRDAEVAEAIAQRDASRAVNADLLAAQRPEVVDARDRRVQARALEEAAAWLDNGEMCGVIAYEGPSNMGEVTAAYNEALEDPAGWLRARAAEIRAGR